MTKRLTIFVCVSILFAGSAPPVQGADLRAAFVQDLVAAINSKNLDRRKALLHPKSLVCVTDTSGSFHEAMFGRQARRGIPATYQWTVTPVPRDQPPMFADRFDYPIHPTHLLQIDYATGPTHSTSVILQLVYDAGQWREVTACPKAETIEGAREATALRAKQSERIQALVAGISPALKNEVLNLIKAGRKVGAITHYATASGEELSTAKAVVERLEAQAR
jgi:hypothetical protein